MIKTGLWYFAGWTFLVVSMPVLLWAVLLECLGRKQARERLAQGFTMAGARVLFRLTGSRIRVKGEENLPESGPVLIVSNHQGHMDSALIHGFIRIPKGFVSIIEVNKFPILRTWMRYMNCIFLDRSDPRQSLECINQAALTLKSGHSMVIFPEGRLSAGDEMNEFKNGSLRLALKAGVPILPVTIKGSHRVMTKNGGKIRAVKVEMAILEPVETKDFDRNGEKDLMKQVWDSIHGELVG